MRQAPVIRAAVAGNLPGMMELLRVFGSYRPEFTRDKALPAWTALLDSPVTTVIVADVGGAVASTCTLAIVPNLTHQGRSWAMIENVATLASHRRQGLGRAVLAFACELAWAAGCYKVSLATGSRSETTLWFYEGAGFVRNGKTFFEMRRANPRPGPLPQAGEGEGVCG